MDDFLTFWEGLGYCRVICVAMCLAFLFHGIFLIFRYRLLLRNLKRERVPCREGVSVIITCSNRAGMLEANLPAFLEQDYPAFEVIVVDECSQDDSLAVLSRLQERYPRLKVSRIPPATKFRCTKKLAINLGILAAQYDVLLFSEIYCRPATSRWMAVMAGAFSPETAVVLGFANYEVKPGSAGKRYFRFIRFWRLLQMVRLGMNFMGDGCNMGYRKTHYLAGRGFTDHTQSYVGYDAEMVRKLSARGNVEVVAVPDAHVLITDDSREAWREDYSYYYAIRRRLPRWTALWNHADFAVEVVFYACAAWLIGVGVCPLCVCGVVVVKCLCDLINLKMGQKALSQVKLFLSSLRNLMYGFAYKGYYRVNSRLTSRKWK